MGNCFGSESDKTRDQEKVLQVKSIYNRLTSQFCLLHEDHEKLKKELEISRNKLKVKEDQLSKIEEQLIQLKSAYVHVRKERNKVERCNQVLKYQMRYML